MIDYNKFCNRLGVPPNGVALLGLMGAVLLLYDKYMKKHQALDAMKTPIFQILGRSFTVWPLTHFLLYFTVGYLYPKSQRVLYIGVAWELFEQLMSVLEKRCGKGNKNKWWESDPTDIIFNALGFYMGVVFNRAYCNKG